MLDLWLKDIAPTDELRRWFQHDPAKWEGFRERYLVELQAKGAELNKLRQGMSSQTLTLLYGARDQEHNEAVVIRDLLTQP